MTLTQISRRGLILGAPVTLLAAKANALHIGCRADSADLLETLPRLKQAGFEGFLTSYTSLQSHFTEPDAARGRLKKSGLRFFGMHVALNRYDPQTAIAPYSLLARVADACAALGAERLIASGASTAHPAALAAKVEGLNRIADYCHNLRIGFAYFGDQQLETLVNGTDHSRVHFVLGASAIDMLAKNARRVDGMQLPVDSGFAVVRKAIESAQWKGWLIAEDSASFGAIRGISAS